MNTSRIASRGWLSNTRIASGLSICIAFLFISLAGQGAIAQSSAPQSPGPSVSSPSAQPGASSQPSDLEIAGEINHKFMESPTLRSLDLGVWVHGGIATLTGAVPNAEVRQQVREIARSTAGIRTVDDQLTISKLPSPAPGYSPAEAPYGEAPGDLPPPPPPPVLENPAQGNVQGQNEGQPGSTQMPAHPPAAEHTAPLPMVTIPAGTPMMVMMLQGVDTKHDHPGFGFHGVVVRDVILLSGVTAIPRGAYVDGTVIDARPSGHLEGRPRLALELSRVEIGHESYALVSMPWTREGPGKGGQTAVTTGGSAAVGAMAGGAFGGGAGAGIGAILGGLGGLGLSALSHGARIVVPAESVLTFYLSAPLTLRAPGPNVIRSLAGNVPASPYDAGYPPPPGSGPYPGPYGRGYPPPGPPPIPGAPPGGYPY